MPVCSMVFVCRGKKVRFALRERTTDSLRIPVLHIISFELGKKKIVRLLVEQIQKITVGDLGGIAEWRSLPVDSFLFDQIGQ